MKKFLSLILALVITALCVSGQKKGTNIIVITGGHDFDSSAFFSMFDSFKGVRYKHYTQPNALERILLKSDDLPDVVVFYDMPQEITDAGKEAFRQLIKNGIGLLFLHHSIVSYQTWPEYKAIAGGKYHEKNSPDAPYFSSYQHDVRFTIRITDPNHPVTKGISDFEVLDEVYGNLEVLPDVHVILSTQHPLSNPVIGWTHIVENSRIVYIQPGHDKNSFNNAKYRQLVHRAILYVAGELN